MSDPVGGDSFGVIVEELQRVARRFHDEAAGLESSKVDTSVDNLGSRELTVAGSVLLAAVAKHRVQLGQTLEQAGCSLDVSAEAYEECESNIKSILDGVLKILQPGDGWGTPPSPSEYPSEP